MSFFRRIILKDPGIGLSGKSVLAAYHSDAEQLFAVTQSLDRVARTLRDPHIRLREVAIALNVAFQPQLAENCPLRELVATRLRGAPFLIETKFDGERVQLHKDGANYRYFSRSGHDWTVTYGMCDCNGRKTILTSTWSTCADSFADFVNVK